MMPTFRIGRIFVLAIAIVAVVLSACSSSEPRITIPDSVVVTPPAEWKLVWSDEFDGAAGSPVDATKWSADTGGNGWGNQEREYYTASTANASLDGAGRL